VLPEVKPNGRAAIRCYALPFETMTPPVQWSFHPIVAAAAPHAIFILPFALMLAAIALMPFIHQHWWERNYPKVALGLGGITACYYLFGLKDPERMLHAGHEYLSFIALIGSLFVVAGGIHIEVSGEARPAMNCLFLLIGAVLANIIGTTGASMLLIRPWIRMNKGRITAFHIVLFIFIVSNVGGCLTPIGDPPLFLGYLKGVPFWWVLKNCWIPWAIVITGLLAVFYLLDRRNFLRPTRAVDENRSQELKWGIEGWRNVGFILLILIAVFIKKPLGLREALMIAAAVGSWFVTPKRLRQANEFDFRPIREVAWLFLGIFATMVPALDYLAVNTGRLGLDSEMKFFWFTGGVSAALDNAPTYLTCLAAAMARRGLSVNDPADTIQFVAAHDRELMAIALGAVFFGAMSYIGNGPNLMVKSIAEHANIKTPDFFGYILKYALPILLPLMLLISLLFFSRWRVF
jgi:Na+/H+ antiporter NhaD/arsenite permease-like protein